MSPQIQCFAGGCGISATPDSYYCWEHEPTVITQLFEGARCLRQGCPDPRRPGSIFCPTHQNRLRLRDAR